MLRYFRINDHYRLIGLFVLLSFLCLPVFLDSAQITLPEVESIVLGEKVAEGFSLYNEIIDSTPPLAAWFYGFCDWVFGRNLTGRHIFAFIILFIQSAFLGFFLIGKKALPENTFIPSVIFSVLTLISFDVLSLTAEVAALGFLLLAVNALLTEIEFRVQRDETILSMGLFIGIGTLINFSYVIYLPGFLIMLMLFTRNIPRKYLLFLSGFMLPHLMLFATYYMQGHSAELWHRFYIPNLSFAEVSLISIKSLMVLCSAPLLYLVISLFILNRDAHLTKYQSQVYQAMVIWFIVALIQVYFSPNFRPQSLLPLAPPVSFFFTHFLLLIKKKRIAELYLWIILVGSVSIAYMARYQKIVPVDYTHLWVKESSRPVSDKRVLVLADEPGVFIKNRIAPAFLNWPLTKEIFDGPQFYENVILVNRYFENDPPEIIIDPENRMEKFFDRIPRLKSKYTKSENGFWVSVNN